MLPTSDTQKQPSGYSTPKCTSCYLPEVLAPVLHVFQAYGRMKDSNHFLRAISKVCFNSKIKKPLILNGTVVVHVYRKPYSWCCWVQKSHEKVWPMPPSKTDICPKHSGNSSATSEQFKLVPNFHDASIIYTVRNYKIKNTTSKLVCVYPITATFGSSKPFFWMSSMCGIYKNIHLDMKERTHFIF